MLPAQKQRANKSARTEQSSPFLNDLTFDVARLINSYHSTCFSTSNVAMEDLPEKGIHRDPADEIYLFQYQSDARPVTWAETTTPNRLTQCMKMLKIRNSRHGKQDHVTKVLFLMLKRWKALAECGYSHDHLSKAANSLQILWARGELYSNLVNAFLSEMRIPKFTKISAVLEFMGQVLHRDGTETEIPSDISDSVLVEFVRVLAPVIYTTVASLYWEEAVLWNVKCVRETEFTVPVDTA